MREYNLEILTFIMFGMVTFSAVFYNGLSLVQKMMLVYMFLFTLHEWEETRFPEGFAKLMLKFFKLKATPNQIHAAHIPVTTINHNHICTFFYPIYSIGISSCLSGII